MDRFNKTVSLGWMIDGKRIRRICVIPSCQAKRNSGIRRSNQSGRLFSQKMTFFYESPTAFDRWGHMISMNSFSLSRVKKVRNKSPNYRYNRAVIMNATFKEKTICEQVSGIIVCCKHLFFDNIA